jgi:uncharacterized membrane protein YeaQ/YmgE (transglycosylase-associated protein family)
MTAQSLIIWLIVGAIAGWLAGIVVRGYGLGIVGNIVVGILGAFVGGWLIGGAGWLPNGLFGSIVSATIGAVILLLLLRLVRRTA